MRGVFSILNGTSRAGTTPQAGKQTAALYDEGGGEEQAERHAGEAPFANLAESAGQSTLC